MGGGSNFSEVANSDLISIWWLSIDTCNKCRFIWGGGLKKGLLKLIHGPWLEVGEMVKYLHCGGCTNVPCWLWWPLAETGLSTPKNKALYPRFSARFTKFWRSSLSLKIFICNHLRPPGAAMAISSILVVDHVLSAIPVPSAAAAEMEFGVKNSFIIIIFWIITTIIIIYLTLVRPRYFCNTSAKMGGGGLFQPLRFSLQNALYPCICYQCIAKGLLFLLIPKKVPTIFVWRHNDVIMLSWTRKLGDILKMRK